MTLIASPALHFTSVIAPLSPLLASKGRMALSSTSSLRGKGFTGR